MEQPMRLSTLLVMAVTAGRLSAGAPASAQPASPPTFRSEARYVEVDAVVTDREGHVVRGLTRDDFRILEDGKPQNIATFIPLDLPVDPPAGIAVPTTGPVVMDVQSKSVDAEYVPLLTHYHRGDVQGAIASLAQWPSARVRTHTRSAGGATGLDVSQPEAGVMLHSDVAMFLAAVDPGLSRQHLDAARALATTLPDE